MRPIGSDCGSGKPAYRLIAVKVGCVLMSDLASLSEQLTDEEWLSGVGEIGDQRGYYEPLGTRHGALFLDESLETLVVCFDTIASARTGSASGIPHGMLQAELNGWSVLSLISHDQSWFRDPAIYSYFDRLVDDAFFEDFDQVIFYGAGINGYAAAAYSVAAPGSKVILVAPQATLDPIIAPWDDRFTHMRRTDFQSRYGYAPDMIDAADEVLIFFDPLEELDAMHAALFRGAQVRHIRMRHAGARIGRDLQDMKVLSQVFRNLADDGISDSEVYSLLRRRRDYMPYLRNLLNRVHIEERHWLTALLCRSVLKQKETPRFRHHFELAEKKLAGMGMSLPQTRPVRKQNAASLLPELKDT